MLVVNPPNVAYVFPLLYVIKYKTHEETLGRALDYRQAVNSFVRLDDLIKQKLLLTREKIRSNVQTFTGTVYKL